MAELEDVSDLNWNGHVSDAEVVTRAAMNPNRYPTPQSIEEWSHPGTIGRQWPNETGSFPACFIYYLRSLGVLSACPRDSQ